MLKLDLGKVEPSLAGPKRPQDRVLLKAVKAEFAEAMDKEFKKAADLDKRVPVEGRKHDLGNGDVVIAAITSCTNTSNPSVMIGAGLLARKAAAKGLTSKPWVKTSLAPGSQVVGEYLDKSGLQKDLDTLGFNLVGYRLHHLHRQFGSAAGRDLQDHQRQRSGRRGGAVGQPQLRRPRERGRARELSRLAAAGRRLRARGFDAGRSGQDAARHRQEGQEGVPQGHLAVDQGDQLLHPQECHQAAVRQEIRQRVQGRRQLAQDRGHRAA